MSAIHDFMGHFDEAGRFTRKEGAVEADFLTPGGAIVPGRLHFKQGLCVRAQVEGGQGWAFGEGSPLLAVQFLLHLEGERPQNILIDHGRVVRLLG